MRGLRHSLLAGLPIVLAGCALFRGEAPPEHPAGDDPLLAELHALAERTVSGLGELEHERRVRRGGSPQGTEPWHSSPARRDQGPVSGRYAPPGDAVPERPYGAVLGASRPPAAPQPLPRVPRGFERTLPGFDFQGPAALAARLIAAEAGYAFVEYPPVPGVPATPLMVRLQSGGATLMGLLQDLGAATGKGAVIGVDEGAQTVSYRLGAPACW